MSTHKPRSIEQQAEIREHERQVVELRKAGRSFEQIALTIRHQLPTDNPGGPYTGELVYADRSGPWRAWQRVIRETILEPADDERKLQLMQIEQLWATWYPIALDASRPFAERVYAERTCERLLIRRAKLTGADMPTSVRLLVTDKMQADIEALAAELGVGTDPAGVALDDDDAALAGIRGGDSESERES
ncbi:MAG: hypothetical protein AB7T06_24640 [Kofleriaceae bacterium]